MVTSSLRYSTCSKYLKGPCSRSMFYCYLVLPPLAMLMLIIFVIVAKRYKFRERERHINIQAIAEEHYERYLRPGGGVHERNHRDVS